MRSRRQQISRQPNDDAQGDPEAVYQLAWSLRDGRGVARNAQRALTLFIAAADAGHVGAQYSAGHMLATGDGVRRNYRRAAIFYARAASQGDSPAMYNLAR